MAERRPKVRDPLRLLVLLVGMGAVILLVYRVWGWGVALLLAAALLLVARADLGRGDPALSALKARAAVLWRVLAARSRGQMEIFRERREYAELEAERARLFGDLGEAVYTGDDAGEKAARQALEAVIRRLAEKEAEVEALVHETEARVRRAQGSGEDDGGSPGGIG